MHQRHRALGARVAQVGIEAGELVGDQHALVVDRARGARGHVQTVLVGELADAADHEQLALEGVLVEVGGTLDLRAEPHEQLPDRGAAGARGASRAGGVHRHLAPAEHSLALGAGGALEQLAQARTLGILGREEAHQHPVAAGRRQLEVHDGAQQLVGHLHEDPRAVARRGIGAGGAAVLEVLERLDRLRDHLVGGHVVQARNHAHPARIVLEAGVVEANGLGRLFGLRSHGSALGRAVPPAQAGSTRAGGVGT